MFQHPIRKHKRLCAAHHSGRFFPGGKEGQWWFLGQYERRESAEGTTLRNCIQFTISLSRSTDAYTTCFTNRKVTSMQLRHSIKAALVVLAIAMASLWGCKDQPTAPQVTEKTQSQTPERTKTNLQYANLPKTESTGSDHGYFWSLYVSGGSASISFPSAGTYAGNFAINYSGVNDVVGGKGWNPGSAHSIGYNIGYLSGSYNFVGIYGWTTSPLIEYYVAEKGSVVNGTYVNSVSSDGHTYSFYKHQQVNQPSIIGTATFWQYLDTWGGASTGSNGSVNMSNHINNWKSKGGQGFGSYNYQILALEAWGGRSGNINATVWGQ